MVILTYSTSHLAISVLAVYFILPKKTRSYLKENPKMLFLTSLGAIFPDLDLFTSGHRAYLHSFYYPIILALIAPEIGKRVKFQNFAIHLRLFSVFWFTHMIFDMTFGPIALFFPLDTRFYDISAGIIFVNWTPEDRVQYFGAEFIKWSISDFFLHSALILWYVLYVISPLVREKKWRKPVSKISDFGFHIRMIRWQTPILLFILTTSIFLGGPIHGNSWEEQSSFRVEIGVASDFVQPYGSVQVNSPEGSQLTIDVSSQSEDLNYSIFVLPVEETIYNQLRSQTKDLIVSLDNGTMTFTEYRVEYLE
ncbi:MAG: metal-dependent hydrolase, partial [Candidatus Kariarchaeaceae archaeon]